jgi:hypothetical protein
MAGSSYVFAAWPRHQTLAWQLFTPLLVTWQSQQASVIVLIPILMGAILSLSIRLSSCSSTLLHLYFERASWSSTASYLKTYSHLVSGITSGSSCLHLSPFARLFSFVRWYGLQQITECKPIGICACG